MTSPHCCARCCSPADGDFEFKVILALHSTGTAYKGDIFGADEAEDTMNTNFIGTMRMCEAMKPLLTENGRIVNVSSMAGSLRIFKDPAMRAQ